MDKSAEKDKSAPEKRSVRRRLVQSTLFHQKSQEIESNGEDQKVDKDCEVDVDNDDDQDYSCGNQGKKTKKRKGKTTPRASKAPKELKEKSPKKTTPKKNGKISSNLMESEGASPPIPNLRLEAKLTAEENSRMFAGKQMHPFFSSWKAGKRNQDVNEVDNNCCLIKRKDKSSTIGPIHVFERCQDEVVSIDWKNWTFYEETVVNSSCCLEGTISSIFDGSDESLKFDKFLCIPHPSSASSDPCHTEKQLTERPEVSVVLVDDDQEECHELVNGSYVGHQLEGVASFLWHAGSMRKSDVEEKSTPQKSSRMMSYYSGCGNRPEDRLWTDKYRPKNAMEVCGNRESVKFISEWLQHWHERDVRAVKDSAGGDKCNMQYNNRDHYVIDSDSETIDEGDSLKNVLLVTGPVGSGKSAAIHACAYEKGFKVLENNASDYRHAAVVKQKFGEALESRSLNRSLVNPTDFRDENIMKSTQTLCNGDTAQQVDDEMIKVIHTSDEENSHGVVRNSENHVCRERIDNDRGADVKPLILFEDVDILFPEDRGFIAAIQQIAGKAKGPVILTSNSSNITLPDNLDRLEVSFTMPTPKDLLSCLYTICTAEKLELQPHYLEQLIGCCQADIRKTIMHLQFWYQNERYGKDKKLQKMYGQELFDPEARHRVLPKIIPWGFSSQLSELVEEEIVKSLCLMEENPMREVVEGEGHDELPNSQDMHNNPADSVEVKKEAMLNRNSILTSNEFADPFGIACEVSNFPPTPVSFSRRNIRRRFNVVTSSDSEDDLFCNGSLVAERDANNELFSADDSRLPSHFLKTQNCASPSTDNLLHSEAEKLEENHYRCSELVNDFHINGTCKSVAISCAPESSFVPETQIENGEELLSGTVCSGYVAETVEVSVANEFDLNFPPIEADNNSELIVHKSANMLENICDGIAESYVTEKVEDSQNEHLEAVSRGYQVMDECSRMDFKRKSKFTEKIRYGEAIDLVRESWKKLRGSNTDLKQYVTSEMTDAFQIVKLADGMCKLISEADLLHSKCQTPELLEKFMFPQEVSDAFDWCDEHLQMTSIIAQHGLSIYAKDISAKGLSIGSKANADLTWETLACRSNIMASGKLFEQDQEASGSSYAGKEILLERERKSDIFNRMKSIVPSKSYLALKGDALHEYLSSLRCISRSESSRLSGSINKTKKRRTRGSRHYLSSGALMLTHEDISLLAESNLYGKISSELNDGSFR